MLAGCTTTLLISAKNKTATPLDVAVLVKDDPNAAATRKFTTRLEPDAGLEGAPIGSFKSGTPVEVRLALPSGGITQRSNQALPSSPDPFTMAIEANTIQGEQFDPSDASSIERQVSDVSGSYLSPTADVGALLAQSMGGIYVRQKTGDIITFQRKIDPRVLNAAIGINEFMPDIGKKPEYRLVLKTDETHSAKLKAQIPSVVDFKTDFNQSMAYMYDFTMKDTAWRRTPNSWYAVERGLLATAEGKKTLGDVKALLAQEGELYYLDSAFVMGQVHMEVSSAVLLDMNADISRGTLVSGSAAFNWQKKDADTKDYKNLVLRVSYERLTPALQERVGDAGTIMHPLFVEHIDNSLKNEVGTALKSAGKGVGDMIISASRASKISPFTTIRYAPNN
jgi:hypothetical protein